MSGLSSPSAEVRDRLEDLEQEWYERVTGEIEAEHRAEFEREFGPKYREGNPFKLNSARVHAEVMARLAKIKAENAD
jgi:hypothetical protein